MKKVKILILLFVILIIYISYNRMFSDKNVIDTPIVNDEITSQTRQRDKDVFENTSIENISIDSTRRFITLDSVQDNIKSRDSVLKKLIKEND